MSEEQKYDSLVGFYVVIEGSELYARFRLANLHGHAGYIEGEPPLGAVVERKVTSKEHPLHLLAQDFILKLTDAVAEEMGLAPTPVLEQEGLSTPEQIFTEEGEPDEESPNGG